MLQTFSLLDFSPRCLEPGLETTGFALHLESPNALIVKHIIHLLQTFANSLLEEQEYVYQCSQAECAKDTMCLPASV
jgi:hypothetical protein